MTSEEKRKETDEFFNGLPGSLPKDEEVPDAVDSANEPTGTTVSGQQTEPGTSKQGVFLKRAKGMPFEDFVELCVKQFREAGFFDASDKYQASLKQQSQNQQPPTTKKLSEKEYKKAVLNEIEKMRSWAGSD